MRLKCVLFYLLLAGMCSCRRQPPVENPKIIQDNPVRPKRLSEPLSVVTNATNQIR